MAERILYDKSALGDSTRSRTSHSPQKADIDVFPKQLRLDCGSLSIESDGTPQHIKIFIDGKPAKGIYSLKLNFNIQRLVKIEIGAFLDDFCFDVRPRKGD